MNEALRGLNELAQQAMDGSPSRAGDETGYINIKFQCGPIQEVGVNGTSIENVVELLVQRLEGFQNGPFSCRENALAITHLQDAQNWLERRTRNRVSAGVEGTNKAH
jgi:hypothetical protein